MEKPEKRSQLIGQENNFLSELDQCLEDQIAKNEIDSKSQNRSDKIENQLEKRRALYARFGYDIEKERQAVIEAAKPFGGRILEAGTGKGHFALALARSGYKLVSFDRSEEQLKVAAENIKKSGANHLVELKREDAEKLSFPDGSFDTIFSVNMIHHLKNPFVVISELIRVLSPSGKLVICDFSPKGMAMMAEVYKLEGGTHEESSIGLEEVEKYLKKFGFEIKKSETKYEITLVAQRVIMK
ncbi:MAG: class I SAM-dependent methyltransferase [Candidatus Saccharicenans sp.]|nr:MAG: hypothetical protein C0168_05230 [Candidatus Aminicenantes bacterium]HEK85438.1 class I SAM-dependent methyltransferase [Candidatus Aminicenantes bacterium]